MPYPQSVLKGFLFIDLNNSVECSATLGHLAYSRMLVRCFEKLDVLAKDRGIEVYQYVGDEAVLVWDELGQIEKLTTLFFDYCDWLENQQPSDFEGWRPTFKAGAAWGEVAENILNRERVYHGAVVGIAARLCQQSSAGRLWLDLSLHRQEIKANYNLKEQKGVKVKGLEQGMDVWEIFR